MKRLPLFLIGAAIVMVTNPAVTQDQESINPKDLIGTWEWLTLKNLTTGEVDSIASKRVAWVTYTGTHNLFLSMERDRPVLSRSDLAKLSPEERMKVNYGYVWNDKNQTLFTGIGTTYTLDGNKITYTTQVSLSPSGIGRVGSETIVHLDRTTLIIHRPPNSAGVVFEETFRRLD
jgi:hypothetical protein